MEDIADSDYNHAKRICKDVAIKNISDICITVTHYY